MPQNFTFDGIALDVDSIEATYEGVTLTATVDPTTRDRLKNEYADQAGKVKKLVFEDGGFQTYDQSNTGISALVVPSDVYDTVYSDAIFRLRGYGDAPTSQSNTKFTVDLDLLREKNRNQTKRVTQTQNGDEWLFSLYNDVVTTESAEINNTSEQGVISLSLTTRDSELVRAILENPTKQDAINTYTIPDGDDTIVDTSPGQRNTVDIVPTDNPSVRDQLPIGEYVITSWSVSLTQPNLWNISLTVSNNTLEVRSDYVVTGEETYCNVTVTSGATLTVEQGDVLNTACLTIEGTVNDDGKIVVADKYDSCKNKELDLVDDYTIYEEESYRTVTVESGATLTIPNGTVLNCTELTIDGTVTNNGILNVGEQHSVC